MIKCQKIVELEKLFFDLWYLSNAVCNRQCRPFVESLEPESGLLLELCKFLSLSKNSSQTQSWIRNSGLQLTRFDASLLLRLQSWPNTIVWLLTRWKPITKQSEQLNIGRLFLARKSLHREIVSWCYITGKEKSRYSFIKEDSFPAIGAPQPSGEHIGFTCRRLLVRISLSPCPFCSEQFFWI